MAHGRHARSHHVGRIPPMPASGFLEVARRLFLTASRSRSATTHLLRARCATRTAGRRAEERGAHRYHVPAFRAAHQCEPCLLGRYLRSSTRPPTGRLLRSCTSLAPAAGSPFEVHPSPQKGRRVGASHKEARTRRRRLVGALLSLSLSLWLGPRRRSRSRASNVGRAICSAFDQMGPVGPRDRPRGANARARGPAPSRTRMLRQANAGAPPPVCRRGARKAGSNPGQALFFQKVKSKSKSIPTKTRCV